MKKLYNKETFHLVILLFLPLLFYIGVQILVHYNSHTICIFKILTGHQCWGCGMTRAFNELFQLHFKEAYSFNPRIVIIAPLLVYIWLSTLIREIQCKCKDS